MGLGPHPRLIESEWVDPGILWFKISPDGASVHWGLQSRGSTPSHCSEFSFVLLAFILSYLLLPTPFYPGSLHSISPFCALLPSTVFCCHPFYCIHSNKTDSLNDSMVHIVFIERLLYTRYGSRKGRQQEGADKDTVPAPVELEEEDRNNPI